MVFSEDVLTQSFDKEVEIGGIRFDTVKLFHPRKGELLLHISLRVWLVVAADKDLSSSV